MANCHQKILNWPQNAVKTFRAVLFCFLKQKIFCVFVWILFLRGIPKNFTLHLNEKVHKYDRKI